MEAKQLDELKERLRKGAEGKKLSTGRWGITWDDSGNYVAQEKGCCILGAQLIGTRGAGGRGYDAAQLLGLSIENIGAIMDGWDGEETSRQSNPLWKMARDLAEEFLDKKEEPGAPRTT